MFASCSGKVVSKIVQLSKPESDVGLAFTVKSSNSSHGTLRVCNPSKADGNQKEKAFLNTKSSALPATSEAAEAFAQLTVVLCSLV